MKILAAFLMLFLSAGSVGTGDAQQADNSTRIGFLGVKNPVISTTLWRNLRPEATYLWNSRQNSS
jgi:hypothetical protein